MQGVAKEQEIIFVEFVFNCDSHIHREGIQGNPSGFLTGTMEYQWFKGTHGGFYVPVEGATRSVRFMLIVFFLILYSNMLWEHPMWDTLYGASVLQFCLMVPVVLLYTSLQTMYKPVCASTCAVTFTYMLSVDPAARVTLEGRTLLEGGVLTARTVYVGGIEGASIFR